MSRYNRRNGVPDRWLDYKAVGRRLRGTRFIAFKVPLKQSLNRQLPHSDAFGPWELLDALSRDQQELGLVIDLTFTTRYYQLQDVPDSLLVLKIFTAGHEVPSDDTILSFKRAVRQFLRDNADNDKLIGVHCTHGLNRTGYLICRYLIDVDGMDPEEAVELFNSARGHAIERPNYIQDLQRGPRRSNDGMEESDQEPARGQAARRPRESDSRDERRPHASETWHHRSYHHSSHHHHHHHHRHHPHDGYPPSPTRLDPPPHHPYRWAPPPPDSPRRRPPRSEDGRSRYPAAEPEWSRSSRWKEDRWRSPPPLPPLPPFPPHPPTLPRYSPRWTNGSHGLDAPGEEWAASGTRHEYRYAYKDRVNAFDRY